ncbi:MAG: hypothetical protein K6F55_07860, partial [Eubacterium sp.]|nr:hypothetical protein [Eubacterium sp.]
GLFSLTPGHVSMRTNIREDMLYRYYSNTDEILSDIVDYYFRFDNAVFNTVRSLDSNYVDKLHMYIEDFATYYGNYQSLSAIMMQYEELLHNTTVRDKIESGYLTRYSFLHNLFDNAIKNKEIKDDFSPVELADFVTAIFRIKVLNRRVMNTSKPLKDEIIQTMDKWFKYIIV